MKVHLPGYMESEEKSNTDADVGEMTGDETEKDSDISEIMFETKVDTLFEIARFKKYSCEKCPYASAKRSHYEKHVELHGSKQRHMCKYCDYSVPSRNLLVQHERLHSTPNQNLLAIQSLSNLLQLPQVPADVALASALPPIDTKKSFKVSVTHDHIELYENSNQFDIEPKKLYRCDRCPYANVRRDHLLTHLKFHMIKSVLACPYCDYSVSKQHHLSQHIRVHFCPLPELSNWLAENGQLDRVKQSKDPDISEALYVAQLYKRDGEKEVEDEKKCNGENEVKTEVEMDVEDSSVEDSDKKEENDAKKEDGDMTPVKEDGDMTPVKEDGDMTPVKEDGDMTPVKEDGDMTPVKEDGDMTPVKEDGDKTPVKEDGDMTPVKEENPFVRTTSPESDTDHEISFKDSSIVISPSVGGESTQEKEETDIEMNVKKEETENDVQSNGENSDAKDDSYICQYCDREFDKSEVLVQHEMQHLIGNNYEVSLHILELICLHSVLDLFSMCNVFLLLKVDKFYSHVCTYFSLAFGFCSITSSP
jgi:KRAB domain-containing zinc finger protein